MIRQTTQAKISASSSIYSFPVDSFSWRNIIEAVLVNACRGFPAQGSQPLFTGTFLFSHNHRHHHLLRRACAPVRGLAPGRPGPVARQMEKGETVRGRLFSGRRLSGDGKLLLNVLVDELFCLSGGRFPPGRCRNGFPPSAAPPPAGALMVWLI